MGERLIDLTGDNLLPIYFIGLPLDFISVILLPLLLPYEVNSKLPLRLGSGLSFDGDLKLYLFFSFYSKVFARISISKRSSESA